MDISTDMIEKLTDLTNLNLLVLKKKNQKAMPLIVGN